MYCKLLFFQFCWNELNRDLKYVSQLDFLNIILPHGFRQKSSYFYSAENLYFLNILWWWFSNEAIAALISIKQYFIFFFCSLKWSKLSDEKCQEHSLLPINYEISSLVTWNIELYARMVIFFWVGLIIVWICIHFQTFEIHVQCRNFIGKSNLLTFFYLFSDTYM